MDFGKAVRIARSIAGLSQAELALRAKVDASLISMIEAGKRQPSTATITDISRHLGIPVHVLTMLGAEASDLRDVSPAEFQRLSESIARTVLQHERPATKQKRRRTAHKHT